MSNQDFWFWGNLEDPIIYMCMMSDLHREITICLAGAIPSRKYSIKVPDKFKSYVYVLTESYNQWSKFIGPPRGIYNPFCSIFEPKKNLEIRRRRVCCFFKDVIQQILILYNLYVFFCFVFLKFTESSAFIYYIIWE